MLNEPITLVPQRLHIGYWNNNHASMWSYDGKHSAFITRHHDAGCAPFWMWNDRMTDDAGRMWLGPVTRHVMDDFGNLQEVMP